VPGSVGDPVGVGGFGGILIMIAIIVTLQTNSSGACQSLLDTLARRLT
jgi:hypothetical protein